ncbi:hypothetical protein EPA93_45870 [Ktedonosporobacter rubrisoli]|uniref:Uncharacterized protein n=1 Tax=Ktedonosporobacter rubrisoli TaxID=2509675 RepID=A0A4P6K5S7_KTERU|nr:hypothetical protein [Ktedonosporobacter rubrisoli]QBD82906.1 hypothetical protein EPA93_45870 [Ktedonosporobacter rubrisoli]
MSRIVAFFRKIQSGRLFYRIWQLIALHSFMVFFQYPGAYYDLSEYHLQTFSLPGEASRIRRLQEQGTICAVASAQKQLSEIAQDLNETPSDSAKKGQPVLGTKQGSDYDVPYNFMGASSSTQAQAWIRLLARIQRGELQP